MSLQAIPEKLLYELLPSSIIDRDQRSLLQAVIGGYQDRQEDIRSYVKRYEVFLDPLRTTPEGSTNSVFVEFVGDQGKVIQRSVELDISTPDPGNDAALTAWVAGRIQVDVSSIVRVLHASDPLRLVDVNLLEHLASTIGAVVYKTDATTRTPQRQRQIVESYFPRLKIKGTVSSFSVLGRLLGFDDATVTPLWGRVSPRLPIDIGSPVNDPDFLGISQYEPAVQSSIFYDPNKLDDGPFYVWQSDQLLNEPDDPSYYTSVNGQNPFVIVKVTGSSTFKPDPGVYVLGGGAPHTKASVSPAGSGLTFEALAEGEIFNGLNVTVTATGSNDAFRQLSVLDRLSSVKYRTSYFDLSLFSDLDLIGDEGIKAIQFSSDLRDNPTLVPSGTAVSPFYPWSSGTQVGPNEAQLDTSTQSNLGVQVTANFDEVRAATRFSRRLGVGYYTTDAALYAAFQARTDLATTSGVDVYSGTALGFPEGMPHAIRYKLTAYWRFDEGSGNRVDIVRGIILYDVNGVESVAGKTGPAASFTAASLQRLNSTETILHTGAVPFTISAWVNINDLSSGPVIMARDDGASNREYLLCVQSNGSVRFVVLNGVTGLPEQAVSVITDVAAVTVGTWHHVVAFFDPDASEAGVVVDDSTPVISSISTTVTAGVANIETAVGALSTGAGRFMDGLIDELGFWARRLSANEITLLYNDGDSLTFPFSRPYLADVAFQAEFEEQATRVSPLIDRLSVTLSRVPERNTVVILNGLAIVGGDDGNGNIVSFDPIVIGGTVRYQERLVSVTVATDGVTLTVQYLALVTMSAELDLQPDLIHFSGTGITGAYNLATGSFSFTETDGGLPNGKLISALWNPQTTEVLRVEPSGTIKALQYFDHQRQPEDEPDFIFGSSGTGTVHWQLHDDYGFRRSLTAGGELVDTNFYQPPVIDVSSRRVDDVMLAVDHQGVEHGLIGFDDYGENLSAAGLPIRTALISHDTSPVTYRPGRHMVGRDDTGNLYHVGAVQGVLVADPVSFFHPAHRDRLVGWLVFNEHPDDDLNVADRSISAAIQEISGMLPNDRTWDADRGWHLRLRIGVKIVSTFDRDLEDEMSLSFFLKAYDVGVKEKASTVFNYGPISFDLTAAGDQLIAYVLNDDDVRVMVASFVVNGFVQVHARVADGVYKFGVSGSFEATAQLGTYQDFSSAVLTIKCVDATFGIHDLRIWNKLKTYEEILRVGNYPKSASIVNYAQSHFITAGRRERWGLRIIPSGFAVPVAVENITSESEAYVLRYSVDARYQGDLRYKEVGLGSGQPFPEPWKVGNRFFSVSADGRSVVSGTHSSLPGVNELWDVEIAETGVFDGSVISPGLLDHTNPIREHIWVEGDDGVMFDGVVDHDGQPFLKFTPVEHLRPVLEHVSAGSVLHAPTDAEVQISTFGSLMSVRLSQSGTYEPYQSTKTVAFDRPPVYLYNQTQVVVGQAGTSNWANQTEFGLDLGVPARQDPGIISFLSQGTLIPGPHRLTVDSGVVGNPGINFPGFDVEVTLGPDTVPIQLAKGATVKQPRKIDIVEFDVTEEVTGLWATEFNWLNDLDIPAQGIFRDLAIYGYNIRRIDPEVYRIFNASGSLVPVDVSVPLPFTNLPPGGLIASLANAGTISAWIHESDAITRPSDDSFSSKVPLSDMLTATTAQRRDDVIMVSFTGTLALPDPITSAVPSVDIQQTVSSPMTTLWMWAGAMTSTSVNIRARVSLSGRVRAIVAEKINFSQPIYSNVAVASADFISSLEGLSNNVVSLKVQGLKPNTQYYYAVGDVACPDFDRIGTFKTWPEGQASFTFAMSNAAVTGSSHEVFSTIQDQDPLFMLHMGDLHQEAIIAESAGSISSAGTFYQDAYEAVLASSSQSSLYRSLATVYMWDEQDFGPIHSDKNSPGKESAWATYRQYVPHYQLIAGDSAPIYQSFVVGRAYFVVTDLRSSKDDIDDPDTPSKTMMGAVQKEWFKQQLLDANGQYPLIIWVSSVPWIWDGTTVCDDGWCKFINERDEIANFIKNNGIKGVVVVSGNMHALAADDGTNSDYAATGGAGIPVLHAGALDNPGTTKGGPYSQGPAILGSGQFALVTVDDNGSEITVTFSGRDSSNVENINFVFKSSDSPKL